jgi:hypothetical protein
MKHQNSCGPHLGKLVHQLPAYDLRFRCTITRWIGINEKNFILLAEGSATVSLSSPKSLKKHHLGPQNDLGSLEPKKLPRWKTVFRASGIGGWPQISTWINPSSLGRNSLHCIDFPHQMRKCSPLRWIPMTF